MAAQKNVLMCMVKTFDIQGIKFTLTSLMKQVNGPVAF